MTVLSKLMNISRDPKIIARKLHQNRRIVSNPAKSKGTHSSRRINLLIKKLQGSYLEIGVAHGYTIEAVEFPTKYGVDPLPKCKTKHVPSVVVNKATSDEYFEEMDPEREFVGIFLDGAHTFQQSYRDLINSLNHLSPNGFILFDDTVPEDQYSAMNDIYECHKARKAIGSSRETWSGDVFKSILVLHHHHPQVEIHTIITPQHPQTIIYWKHQGKNHLEPVSEQVLNEYKDVTHEEIFGNFGRAHSIFNFGFELDVIEKFLKK